MQVTVHENIAFCPFFAVLYINLLCVILYAFLWSWRRLSEPKIRFLMFYLLCAYILDSIMMVYIDVLLIVKAWKVTRMSQGVLRWQEDDYEK